MKRIIVVEDDPVVWLDLAELLSSQFSTETIARLNLKEAIAVLPELSGDSTAVVLSDLPPAFDALAEAVTRGVRLVITNTVPPGHTEALAGARIIGRPFDGSALLAALT
jgi:CheY-like chemotaxis protein